MKNLYKRQFFLRHHRPGTTQVMSPEEYIVNDGWDSSQSIRHYLILTT